MKLLIVCDPPSSFVPYKDTTKALIESAWARGHAVDWTATAGLSVNGQGVKARAIPLHKSEERVAWYTEAASRRVDTSDYDWILVRSDPPVDTAYLHMCQILALRDDLRRRTVNDPVTLASFNEKLSALRFSAWMPPTLVTASQDDIRAFAAEQGGTIVGKPLDSMGGGGVVVLETAHVNFNSLVAQLTGEGTRSAVVQRYIERVREGDKRVLLVDGRVAGAVLRVPKDGDFRGNIAAGASVQSAELSRREREVVDAMGDELVRLGLRFVGLDLVGEYLTEVNVTSPTGAQEIRKLSGIDVADQFIKALESNG